MGQDINIIIYQENMKGDALEAHSKLLEIQSRLTKFAYLSKQPLPGAADALIFQKLKNAQKMPTKQRYFNFYHWYCTMAQFAQKQIERWLKDKDSAQDDKLIQESLAVIEGLKNKEAKLADQHTDYIMNIFIKEPIETNIIIIKNKLLMINGEQIGQELKITFKNNHERGTEYSQNSNELRIMFKLKPTACEKLKDIVSKWPEVKNIQIKKQMKDKRN